MKLCYICSTLKNQTMNKLFSGASAIGIIIVVIGVFFLVRNIFDLDIPVFTILLSAVLIVGGVFMIRGSFAPKHDAQHVQFGDTKFAFTPGQQHYNVLFGEGSLNLKGQKPDSNIPLSVECSFGQFRIIADREVPLKVKGNVSFGTLRGPDMKTASFGEYTYMSPDYNPAQPGFTIDVRVSFGEVEVFYI